MHDSTPVDLVRECTKEAVAVADRWGGVQPKKRELCRELFIRIRVAGCDELFWAVGCAYVGEGVHICG